MIALVVDDDAVMQLVTTHVLAADGYTVHVAGTGADAIEIAQRERVDLILLDLTLDDEDGLDVAERLRAQVSHSFDIIVLSGRTDMDGDARIATTRIAGIIHKPFDPASLCDRIRSILLKP